MIDKAFLEITNLCNLSCDFCHKTAREGRMMTEAEFEALTDRLCGRVQYLYFHLMGEPLLHPLLGHFVLRARQKGFRPMLTTNGTLLGQRGEALLEAMPYKISISLHAPAANAAFSAPRYLADVLDFARRSAEKGIITVLRLWNLGGEGERENEAVLAALHRAFEGEWRKNRSGMCLAPHLFLEWGREFAWPDLSAEAIGEGEPLFCYGLRDQIGVLVDGSVLPCCLDAEGVITLGNLHDTSLEDILASPRARAIYEGFGANRATEALCRRCGYARRFQKRAEKSGV
ncbi:MAG: radical SAM protein [Ruminococcaceae bacterium]|nr:radical SAM protein [Oscillospiraceae bacterium]